MKQIVILLLALVCVQVTLPAQAISEKKLKKHIQYLASDKLKGRGTGSPEEKMAAEYIAKQFKKIGLQPKGTAGDWMHQYTFKKSSDPHGMNHDGPEIRSNNVVGYLDNGAPYTVIIGAHYDHLGLGHDGNSLEANSKGMIHNGADDNASGTAGVIELARYLVNNGVKEQHNFLFICFSGEELGLFGSKKYAEYPTIDFAKVSYMLNMDMIGRLNEEKRLLVGGVGTSPSFVPLLNGIKTDLTIKHDSAGVGPSDHTSFYLKNIPVLFVFTGQHKDYHKPSDDVDKVNFAGEVQVLDMVIRIIEGLDSTPKLVFQETKTKKENTGGGFKVTLGIMPDYTWDGEGVRVDGVTEDRPAAKAGVQKGDLIIGLGSINVADMQAYMQALRSFTKGETTSLKIKRDGKEMTMPVTF